MKKQMTQLIKGMAIKGISHPATSPTKNDAPNALATNSLGFCVAFLVFEPTQELQRNPTGHWIKQLLHIVASHSEHLIRESS
jgi:hypothetical protein